MTEPRWWIYREEEVSERPYTREELGELDLVPSTLLCREGEEKWNSLEDIEELEFRTESDGDDFPPLTMPEEYADRVDREVTPDRLHEEGLYVTGLDSTDQGYSLTFNGSITIHGVQIEDGTVRWPREKEDSEYPLVKIHQPELEQAIAGTIESGSVHEGEPDLPAVTVARFNPYESGQLKGFFDLSVQDVLVIKGFKLMESNDGDGYWVGVPSINRGGDWIDQVEVAKELKQTLSTLAEAELGG